MANMHIILHQLAGHTWYTDIDIELMNKTMPITDNRDKKACDPTREGEGVIWQLQPFHARFGTYFVNADT